MFADLLAGLPAFLFYLSAGIVLLMAILFVYKFVTPHDELALIRANNTAAAAALSGALVGLALPIASASLNSVSLLDFVVWGAIGCVVQIIAFFVASLFLKGLPARIDAGEVSAGIFAGGMAIAFGIVNAVSMVP